LTATRISDNLATELIEEHSRDVKELESTGTKDWKEIEESARNELMKVPSEAPSFDKKLINTSFNVTIRPPQITTSR